MLCHSSSASAMILYDADLHDFMMPGQLAEVGDSIQPNIVTAFLDESMSGTGGLGRRNSELECV